MSTEEKRQSDSGGPAQVGIVMGSDSDLSVMESASVVLNDFGVAFEITVASAHRSPQRAAEWASSAHERGIKIIIAGAGHAAHLAGAMAAHTSLPIIGVPIDSSCLQGMDAHYVKPNDEHLRGAMDQFTAWLDEHLADENVTQTVTKEAKS